MVRTQQQMDRMQQGLEDLATELEGRRRLFGREAVLSLLSTTDELCRCVLKQLQIHAQMREAFEVSAQTGVDVLNIHRMWFEIPGEAEHARWPRGLRAIAPWWRLSRGDSLGHFMVNRLDLKDELYTLVLSHPVIMLPFEHPDWRRLALSNYWAEVRRYRPDNKRSPDSSRGPLRVAGVEIPVLPEVPKK